MYKEFDDYVYSFDFVDKGINRKIFHSKRVSVMSALIAEKLNWSYADILLAKQIGLLHDIGRFTEWTKFKKYGQNKFDHGDYGVKILKENNYIEKFNINKQDCETVYQAVYYHNKLELPEEVNNKHAKLIRDADKIDILYLHTIDNDLYTYNNDYGNIISPKIRKRFLEEKPILVEDITNYGEFIITTLAFVYDINYDYSIKYIKEKQYIEKMYDKLETKDIYEGYFNKINDYIEKRFNNVR